MNRYIISINADLEEGIGGGTVVINNGTISSQLQDINYYLSYDYGGAREGDSKLKLQQIMPGRATVS